MLLHYNIFSFLIFLIMSLDVIQTTPLFCEGPFKILKSFILFLLIAVLLYSADASGKCNPLNPYAN